KSFRYDFALTVDGRNMKPEGIIEIGNIPNGKYATIHCVGKLEDVAQAWDYLYKKWLPESSYQPKHYPALEEFVQGPEEIGWENFNLKCRIPIEKI
ncbi:MAG: GyrI-like domain-containing protein, partial [Ignavibacteriae bacterium]|nr:GyrI-like domain-containing protein [Ignavibacteriota bacterium]